MAEQKSEYRRLSSVMAGLLSGQSLWLGPDHLLSVTASGFHENYRRFYFRDIQAVVVRKTRGRLLRGILLAVLLAVSLRFTIVAFSEAWDMYVAVMLSMSVPCLLVLLMLDILLGPTCSCHLQTAVQIDHLLALNRLRSAEAAILHLKEAVVRVQGDLTPEHVERLKVMSNERNAAASTAMPGPFPAAAAPAAPLSHCMGRAHFMLFSLLLIDMVDTGFALIDVHVLPDWLSFIMLLVVIVLIIVALITQSYSDLARRIKRLTMGVAVYFTASIILLVGTIIYRLAQDGGESLSSSSVTDSPFILTWDFVSAAASGVFGSLGMIWLYRFRKEHCVPPPVVTPGAESMDQGAGEKPQINTDSPDEK